MVTSGKTMMSGGSSSHIDNTIEVDKYINDFRLLEIRCGVLEEEKHDY